MTDQRVGTATPSLTQEEGDAQSPCVAVPRCSRCGNEAERFEDSLWVLCFSCGDKKGHATLAPKPERT